MIQAPVRTAKRWWPLLAAGLHLTCTHPGPPPAAPAATTTTAAGEAEPALPPLPKLPPSPVPLDHPELRAVTVEARDVSDGIETLIATVGNEGLACGRSVTDAELRIGGAADPRRPFSIWVRALRPDEGAALSEGGHLVVRRPAPAPGEHQIASLTLRGSGDGCDGAPQRYRFALPDAGPPVNAPEALAHWADALAHHVRGATAWGNFAAERINERFPSPRPPSTPGKRVAASAASARPRVAPARRNPQELTRLMDTTTGMTSLQETLQTDRWLIAPVGEPATVPLADVKGPPLPQHPWPAMLAALEAGRPKGAPAVDEPLAAAAPASFYFVRFRAISDLVRLRAELAARLDTGILALESRAAAYDLSERYEAELGLKQGPMTRLFGPSVVEELAVVGSDPYLREGSDLTLIFRLKAKPAFEAALATTLMVHGAEHGGVTTSSVVRDGVTIQIARSPDGAVRRHRATVGDFELVSNSLAATERVIAAIQKRASRLADEPDFRYMLARDAAVPADVLAFMSDRFVAEAVGPRQKILEARRQLALAELSRPGFAALLYGWVHGRAPVGVDELLASGLLKRSELAHADGEPITWTPEGGARSSWGTVGGLVPLIDRPTPAKVTAAESEAYKLFVSGYQSYWSTYVDPVAVRVALPEAGTGPLAIELRVLPIIGGTDYAELAQTVGHARVVVGDGRQGARAVLGIGADAQLRQLLSQSLTAMPLVGALKIDWLGDWATFGIDDDAAKTPPSASPPGDSSFEATIRQLRELPIFAGVEVRSLTAAAAFLAGARQLVTSAAPGAIEWAEAGKHRDVPFVAVRAARDNNDLRAFQDVTLYYAFCKGSLFLSLADAAIRRRIDECVDGQRPRSPPAGPDADRQSAQLVVDVDMRERGPLWWRAAMLALRGDWISGDRWAPAAAEAVLRGAPGAAAPAALARRTFGAVPTTPEGQPYRLSEDGLYDPLRGLRRPSDRLVWQDAIASENAPLVRLLRVVSHLRSEVSFDDEPRATADRPGASRSLHIKLRLGSL